MSEPHSSQEERLFQLRPRLLAVARRMGMARVADEIADDAILLVLEKIRSGASIDNLERYTVGVVRHCVYGRARRPDPDPLPPEVPALPAESDDPSIMECLDRCLRQHDSGSFILRYYGGDREAKNKEVRKALAAELGTTPNAMFLRATKLRRKLEACILACLAARGGGQETGSPRTPRENH